MFQILVAKLFKWGWEVVRLEVNEDVKISFG